MFNKNSFWLALNYSFFIVISFASLKMNLLNFGLDTFGMWLSISSLWGLGGSVDFGVGFAIVKFVAEKRKQENNDLSMILSSSFFILTGMAILLTLLIYALGHHIYISNNAFIQAGDMALKNEYNLIFVLLACMFFLRYFINYFKSVNEGYNNYVLTSKLDIFRNIGSFVIAFASWSFNSGLFIYAIYNFILTLLVFLANYYFYYKIPDKPSISFSKVNTRSVKSIIGLSGSVQLSTLFGAMIDPFFKYIIGKYYNIGFVSTYETARRFSFAVSGLFCTSFRHMLTSSSEVVEYKAQQHYLNTNCVDVSKLGVIFSGITVGIGGIVIVFMLNTFFNYHDVWKIFLILILCDSMNNFGYSPYIFLSGTGHTFWLAITQFINLVISSLFIMIGLYYFENIYGFIGLPISVFIVNMLTFIYLRKKFELNIREYLIRAKFNKMIFLTISILLISFQNSLYIAYVLLGSMSLLSLIIFWNDIFYIKDSILAKIRKKTRKMDL